GVPVVAEIDLHAADVDVGPPRPLQFEHLAQGLLLGFEVEALRTRGDGPGPRLRGTLLGEPAPGFGERHRLDQTGRNALGALRLAGERGAQAGDRTGVRLIGDDDDGERERDEPAAPRRWGRAGEHGRIMTARSL